MRWESSICPYDLPDCGETAPRSGRRVKNALENRWVAEVAEKTGGTKSPDYALLTRALAWIGTSQQILEEQFCDGLSRLSKQM